VDDWRSPDLPGEFADSEGGFVEDLVGAMRINEWRTHFARCTMALDANLSIISVSPDKKTKRLAAWA
jgi:hypothetical protein